MEFETTAAKAQIEAPTAEVAREVEENADHVHDAAQDAANVARVSAAIFTSYSFSSYPCSHFSTKVQR